MTLEDESGFVNLIVRREQQQQHRTLIMTQQFLGVDGILQTHPSSPYILVSALWQPDLSTLHQVSGYPAQRNFM